MDFVAIDFKPPHQIIQAYAVLVYVWWKTTR